MEWYSAHVVLVVRFNDGIQDKIPVWENIYLIHAASFEEALEQAAALGRAAEGDSNGTFRWEDRAARWEYAGTRKLMACALTEDRPGSGTELTYSEFQIETEDELDKLIRGLSVRIIYEE